MSKDLKEIPINLMIDAVFNNFNDDTELMARWLFKNGYINKNKDGNYIINKKYKPTFFTTKEIKEYDYAFRYLQQENKQYKEENEKLLQKLVYSLSPTTHALGNSYNEKFKQIIKTNLDLETCKIKHLLKKCWEE